MRYALPFLVAAAAAPLSFGGTNYYYLDLNGSTPGFGTLGGYWNDTDQIWSTSAAGDITTVSRVFSSGRNYFSATGWDYDVAVFGASGGSGGLFTIVDGKTIEVNGLIDNVGMSFNALGSGTLNLKGEPGRGIKVAAGVTSQFAMPISINTGANADFDIIGNCTISGALSGSGFDKAGVGTLILTGTNTNSGVTQIQAGTLRLVGAGAVSSASEYFVSGVDGTLELDSGVSINTVRGYSDGFASQGAIVAKSGNNSIQTVAIYILMGGNLSGIKVVADAGATLSIGTVTGSGALYVGGAGDVRITSNTSLYELHKIGIGTLTIPPGAQVTWSGGAIIEEGTLSAQASSLYSLGLHLFSGTLEFNQITGQTYSGSLYGAGAVRKVGLGSLTLTGSNTFSGGLTVNEGTLRVGNSVALTGSGTVSVQGGAVLDLNGFSASATSLAGSGIVQLGAATLSLSPASSQIFPGSIAGAGNVNKTGSFNLTLTGANTFTGTLTSSGGILHVGVGGTSGSIASNLVLSSASTEVVFNRSDDVTYAGSISGSGIVNQRGAGKTTLSGSNTFTGGLNITSGVLAVASSAPLGGGTILLSGGTLASTFTFSASRPINLATSPANFGTIDVLAATTLTWSGALGGAGSLVKAGAGTLILSGFNTYSGSTTVSSGLLKLGSAGAIPSGSQLVVLSGASVDYNGFVPALGGLTSSPSGVETLTVPLSGNGTITMNGTGTLVLSSANTNTGGVVINSGTIRLGVDNALPSPTSVSLAAGSILDLDGHDATFSGITGSGTVLLGGANLTLALTSMTTFGGSIAEFGNVTKSGSFNLYLTGDNTFTGTLTSMGGLVHVGVGGVSGSLTSDVVLSTPSSELVFNRYDDITYGGSISGAGAVNQFGAGVLTLTGNNTFTGGLDITSGTVSVSSAAALGGGSVLLSRGTLSTSASFSTVRPLNLATYPANYGTVDVATGTTLGWSGPVTGGGKLIKTGGGSLVLSGTNTFSGSTSIEGGTVESLSSSALGTAAVQVASGGILRASSNNVNVVTVDSAGTIEGTGSLGAVTLNAGGILSPGAAIGILGASSLTPKGGSSIVWQVRDAGSSLGSGYDGVNVTGTIDFSQAGRVGGKINLKVVSLSGSSTPGIPLSFSKDSRYSFGIIDANSFTFGSNSNLSDIFQVDVSDFRYEDGSMSSASLWSLQYDAGATMITLTAVPEPSTYALGLSALGLAAALVRRRRASSRTRGQAAPFGERI